MGAPQTHVLATSREALRVEGENVYRLDSLSCAPDDPGLTAAVAQTFPATQLFLERAAASGTPLNPSDADAAIIAQICRKLDGVPLAIELAAGRVGAYGLQQMATLLDQRLTLLWPGPRTAPPRQKTLQATLHWSHELLSEVERVVLRRLAVFVGHFTVDAALAVVPSATVNHTHVFGAIDSLVAKSMVAVRPVGAMMRYRLLDTTRAYALETEVDDAELADLAVRHVNYYRRWLEQSGIGWPRLSTGSEREPYLADLNNARAALEWCFGANGDAKLGVGLAAAAAPVFLAMSLVTECLRWSERAIHALDHGRGSEEEMNLQAAVGISSMHIHGESDASRLALSRSLAIAAERGDVLNQVRLLAPLHMFYLRGGDFKATLHYARRSCAVAGTSENQAAIALAHSILGMSLHLMGDLGGARAELELALQHGQGFQSNSTIYLGFDYHNRTAIALARTLWLQGYPAQAVERAQQAIKDAERVGHPIALTIVLHWATSIFLWIGDLSATEQLIDWFINRAETHSLGPSLTIGHAFRGELAIIRGDAKNGVEILQSYLEKLHAAHYELLTSPFNISLVQGLAALSRFTEAMKLIDETIRMIEVNGDSSYLPEALRIKGCLFLRMPQSSAVDAETCFARSLELSRQQGARGWELRTAIDLAALWAAQGRRGDARTTLQAAFAQFTEGFDTADLKTAQQSIATLG
jgi:predicted ATPase